MITRPDPLGLETRYSQRMLVAGAAPPQPFAGFGIDDSLHGATLAPVTSPVGRPARLRWFALGTLAGIGLACAVSASFRHDLVAHGHTARAQGGAALSAARELIQGAPEHEEVVVTVTAAQAAAARPPQQPPPEPVSMPLVAAMPLAPAAAAPVVAAPPPHVVIAPTTAPVPAASSRVQASVAKVARQIAAPAPARPAAVPTRVGFVPEEM